MVIVRKFQQKINETKEKSGLSGIKAVVSVFEMYYWSRKYHLLNTEWFQFKFYHLNNTARKTYVRDYEVLNNIPEKYNKKEDWEKLDNKYIFNQFFKSYLGRDYLFIDNTKKQAFLEFIKKHPKFIKKPLSQSGGSGIEKIDSTGKDPLRLFEDLVKEGAVLVEEILLQAKILEDLNPDSINTIRVVTMINSRGEISIPFAILRIGRKNSCVDNFCSGGIIAEVDINSGIVTSKGISGNLDQYVIHPDTGATIIGLKIPHWEKVKNTVIDATKRIKTLRYIGWDVCVKDNGDICLIEGNKSPEARIHQLTAGKGLRELYKQGLS